MTNWLLMIRFVVAIYVFGMLGFAGGCASVDHEKIVRDSIRPAIPIGEGEKPLRERAAHGKEKEMSGFEAMLIKNVEASSGKEVKRYRVYRRPRYGAGSSFGAAGVFFDYYLYGSDGVLLAYARRQVN